MNTNRWGTTVIAGIALCLASAHAAGDDLDIARDWADRQLAAKDEDGGNHVKALPAPAGLSAADIDRVLWKGVTALEKPRQRLAALKLLVELGDLPSISLLMDAGKAEKDPAVLRAEILLAGLYRDKRAAEWLAGCLGHKDATVRSAAADALGILHHPAYEVPLPSWPFTFGMFPGSESEAWLETDPPIDLSRWLTDAITYGPVRPLDPEKVQTIDLPDSVRDKLLAMMLLGETLGEREAAARALVRWPPAKYEFRYAEWGVWISRDDQLAQAERFTDDIPTFVHRTSDSISSLLDRAVNLPMVTLISKPVVYLKSEQPLAVDLQVRIARGRPAVAYPRPDDFILQVIAAFNSDEGVENGDAYLTKLDPKEATPLKDTYEGYPWLSPNQRRHSLSIAFWGRKGPPPEHEVVSVGLRWQSLIVSPAALPWMRTQRVGPGERFAWWGHARNVPACWVSNRGEAEKFLYYDGPTRAKCPYKVSLAEKTLKVEPQEMFPKLARLAGIIEVQGLVEANNRPATQPKTAERKALLLRVSADGVATQEVTLGTEAVEIAAKLDGSAPAAEAEKTLTKMLTDHGLTDKEAGSLVNCWRKEFFRTAGTRMLLLLSQEDYDAYCPMEIYPTPTKRVRAGLVLYELNR